MSDAFQIQFKNAHVAQAIKFTRQTPLESALANLDLWPAVAGEVPGTVPGEVPEEVAGTVAGPVLVLVGGASGLTADYIDRLSAFFAEVICPLMEAHQGLVIDGGTDAGIMRLMGHSYRATGSTFPLIGVAASGTVCLPEQYPPLTFADFAFLEPNHTHFVLVPGLLWGDESPWIAEVANLLTLDKSLTLLVNGGKISWQDVTYSVRAQRPVLVLAGSGRTADELALAIGGDRSNQRANQLVDSGLLSTVQLQGDWQRLKGEIDRYFSS